MGFGKGSSSSSVQMTPEQTELLKAQTGALKETFLPAYKETIGGAQERLGLSQPYVNEAAKKAYANQDLFLDKLLMKLEPCWVLVGIR
jgi:hypothetical protein